MIGIKPSLNLLFSQKYFSFAEQWRNLKMAKRFK